jgi:NAD(P)-dependent dehydrogenase (short-subunit alcohol dehydrogenase family)
MNQSTGRKMLLLTGAAGQLGTALINLASGQLDILALIHDHDLRAGANGDIMFDAETGLSQRSSVRTFKCDLTSQKEIVAAAENITSLGIRIDYVVNAAGDGRFLGETTDAVLIAEEARKQFELHVFAPAVISSALFHFQWKKRNLSERKISILNVSSLAGAQVFKDAGQAFYAASKAAINMLTMHMAAEYSSYAINVNALAPNSFPNIISTAVVASNALHILSSDATGQIFKIDRSNTVNASVDGGFRAGM